MCPGVDDLRRRSVVLAGYAGDEAVARRDLRDDDPAVRALALSALVRSDAATAADLRCALADDAPTVRRRAAQLLPRAHLPRDERPSLVALLPDPDDRVTEVAAFAAGEIEDVDPATREALVEIATSHTDALCRESAVAALGAIGDPTTLPAVLAATDDRANVRRRATLALAAFEGPEVEAALARLADDRDLQVRQAAEDLLEISRGTHT